MRKYGVRFIAVAALATSIVASPQTTHAQAPQLNFDGRGILSLIEVRPGAPLPRYDTIDFEVMVERQQQCNQVQITAHCFTASGAETYCASSGGQKTGRELLQGQRYILTVNFLKGYLSRFATIVFRPECHL
jgi:putative hemolysin